MAARSESQSHNVAPSPKTLPNSKLSTIHEDSVKNPSKTESVSRLRKRDLIAGVWQETASRRTNVGGGAIHQSEHHQHATGDSTIPKEGPQWKSSIQTGVRESVQTSFGFVMGPLALITAPLKSMQIPIPFLHRQTPVHSQVESRQTPVRESRMHRFRPFTQSQPDTRQRLGMTRQFSVMPNMSVQELNATLIVPVYEQSSWDLAALLLSYCSTGLETGLAVVLFLIPSNLLRKWWNFLVSSWPIEMVYGYWLWIVHSLHSGRRHARTGSAQQRGSIFAAGAALAAYNASMQASYPPRSDGTRRSKWRKI